MHPTALLDRKFVWHPFTQMQDWMKREPIVIESAQGAVLTDVRGNDYLDANSSIWTNLHGHNHPRLNRAIERQLKKVAHSSALGFANVPASQLAAKLVKLAQLHSTQRTTSQQVRLQKVFFSDDGSTAMEVALKLAYEYARRINGLKRPRFLSLKGAYHGDTVGAVSLGHIDVFHKAYSGLLFPSEQVMAPYCYRCPYNRAKPERADAREYRRCNWECVGEVRDQFAKAKKKNSPISTFVVEPLLQGAAGMIAQPRGWLRRVTEVVRAFKAQWIADEVMTGLGRCGGAETKGKVFASQLENVTPDYLALAKGLTGGYLPMAATLTTEAVFNAFLGKYEAFKTFFHGHSFTGNQLGAAVAIESLEMLNSKASRAQRVKLEAWFANDLECLWTLKSVGDIRRVGLVAGVELVKDWQTRTPYSLGERAGLRVCEAMAKRGVLTRPIGSVVVLMPPYCMTRSQVTTMVQALRDSIQETLG